MKYELIQEYPGSPKLGTISENPSNQNFADFSIFWKKIEEQPKFEIVSIKATAFAPKNAIKTWSPTHQWLKLENMLHSGCCVDNGEYYIHSIKRLSDGEIFSVGDNCCWDWSSSNSDYFTIEKFDTKGNIYFKEFSWDYQFLNEKYDFNFRKWINPKPVLFQTEDGVDVYKGDKIFIVYPSLELYNLDNGLIVNHWKPKREKVFSSKILAEGYINRKIRDLKLLSVNEVLDVVYKTLTKTKLTNDLTNLAWKNKK